MALAQWRPLILASAVTAALAGAVVVQTCTRDSGTPPATSDGTPASPPSSPTATPTTPPLPQEPITEVPSPLTRQVFEAGQLVDVTNAIGFLSAETGSIETWSAGEGLLVAASRDGGLLLTTDPADVNAAVLVERATGIAHRLAPRITPLVDSAHGGLLIVGIATDGRFDTAILDLRNRTFRPLGIGAAEGSAFAAYAAADGRRAVMHAGTTIAVVDMVANTAIAIGTMFDASEFGIVVLPGGLGFRIVSSALEEPARWFGWEGDEVTDNPPPGEPTQNGRYFAEDASFGRIRAFGVGAYPVASWITVHDRSTGEDVVRLLGASLVAGVASWTASGDALVVEVPEGYLVVDLDGSVVARIDDAIHWLRPVPSPVINSLFGTTLGTIINTSRGTTVEPVYRDGVVLRARWSDRPGELIVTIDQSGKGRDWPEQVMPFEARRAPLESVPRVAVTGGECAPVFDGVGLEAAEVACVGSATSGEVITVDNPLHNPGVDGDRRSPVAGVRADDGTVLLSVRFEDGTEGWVDASRLGWKE
jgi:hypothetical protein